MKSRVCNECINFFADQIETHCHAESEFKLAVYTVAATLFILSLNVVVLLVCIYLNHVQVHRNSSEACSSHTSIGLK